MFIAFDDEREYGPAMSALNERQRELVKLYLDNPGVPVNKLMLGAGYSPKSNPSHCLHNEAVIKAINEELDKRFRVDAPIGRQVLLKIAQNDNHPNQFKAAVALLERGGFGSEQRIKVEHTDSTGVVLIERIKAAAAALGVDAQTFLGPNMTPQGLPMKLIEGETVKEEKANGK